MELIDNDGVIQLSGKINFDNVVKIRQAGERYMQKKTAVQFNGSAISQYDSSILALFMAWKRFAKQRNITIAFIELPPTLKALAAVYNVQTLLAL